MRPKPFLLAAAALAVLALAIRQVTQAVHRTFGSRPGVAQLARATPAYQNGLTLMEIDNVSPDRQYSFSDQGQKDNGGSSPFTEADTSLWIKLPPNVSLPLGCSGDAYNPCQNLLTVTAHASQGREMPLRWRTSASRSNSDPIYILTSIPAGYPDTIRWADVTLEDHHGDTATWRILHLPSMQHVLTPPVTPQPTFHQGNISVTADAYRGADPSGSHTGQRILFDIHGTITHATHQWELGHLTETREWEPPNPISPDAGSTFGTSKTGSQVSFDVSRQVIGWNRTEPYLNDNHWVRLGAQLQELETYDETVTFHHVSAVKTRNGSLYLAASGPQTITTPSGITVILDDIQHRQNLTNERGGTGYSIHLLFPQTARLPSLSHSPFWRKYRRPIRVSADIPKPYDSMGSSYGDNEGTYHFRTKRPLPKVMANFPVIIRQRIDLRTIPMTFTLPVLDQEPKG